MWNGKIRGKGTWSLPVAALLIALACSGCGDDGEQSADPIAALPVAQTIALNGLPGTVDVVFDDLGMPHIYAPNFTAAVYVQGYVTAQARFWEMDVIRRFATGRLSELFGRLSLSTDVQMRTFFTTRDGRRLHRALWEHVQAIDPEVASLIEAYSAGVNAWLDDLKHGRNGAHLPPEYTLVGVLGFTAEQLAPWEPADTLAVARLQAFSLSDSSGDEIQWARAQQSLADAVFRDVFRFAPAAPTTVLPPRTARANRIRGDTSSGSLFVVPPKILEDLTGMFDELASNLPFGTRSRGAGSNNWIVAPRHTQNGHALLANDPHLALFNPPVWHMLHLSIADTQEDVIGVIFPGLPGVILGHNRHGAWGATTAGYDVTDLYVEDFETPPDYPASPRTVRFRGQRVPVLRVDEPIQVRGRPQPFLLPIEVVPHHGPNVADPDLNDSAVGLAATGMTVRWTGHEITNDARFLFDLQRARSVNDFRNALRNFGVGAQNWIWADTQGNIAYSTQVLIPQRPPGIVPYLPVPGTGEAEWLSDDLGRTLWLPSEKIPQAVNPDSGFLVTANNDQIGGTLDNDPLNDSVYLAPQFANGFRAQRATELLTAAITRPGGGKLTLEDMARFQFDHSSKEAARFLPFLFAAAERRPDLVTPAMAEALERLRRWGEERPGSPPFDTPPGVDAADERTDLGHRAQPVSDEEKADAAAASIFAGFLTRLSRLTFADDFAGTGIGTPGGDDATRALLHLLEDQDRTDPGFVVHTKDASGESFLWDNRNTPQRETRDEILLQALRDGLTFLQEKFSTDAQEQWLWGKIHRVRFQHFLGQAGLNIFDLGPFPAPGFRETVNPGGFSLNSDNFEFSGGASMRFVVELDPRGIRAHNVLPGGNNGDPGGTADDNRFNRIQPDIHFGDWVGAWINGDTFTFRFQRSEVAAAARRKVRFVP
ncbi:MAG: penicillin acylase family protein [Candidatus Binatia bacterium]|nr:penicillin acylase family protein [Candidatus Binatia bacterium]